MGKNATPHEIIARAEERRREEARQIIDSKRREYMRDELGLSNEKIEKIISNEPASWVIDAVAEARANADELVEQRAGRALDEIRALEARIDALERENERTKAAKDNAVQQAQIWSIAAKTQHAIVQEIGALVGCSEDWRVAEAVRDKLERVRELAAKWRAVPQDPDEPLLAIAADELEAALSQPTEQHDPLAVSDHCPECSEPEPECVCGEQPDERESLPLMARREGMCEGAKYAYWDRDSVRFQSLYKPGRAWEFCYRIADTDEHGLPVVERTADMPKRAKYRITYITQKGVYYTSTPQLALEASRSGAVSERIEDYRHGQEG